MSSFTWSSHFKTVEIPNAYCGDGKPYKIFIDEQDSKQLVFELMGGGVCWSSKSCTGGLIRRRAWTHRIPKLFAISILSSRHESNPYKHATHIYLPYCSADIWSGSSVSIYPKELNTELEEELEDKNLIIKHYGAINVEESLKYLVEKIDFKKFDDVMVYGASAGALGSIVHLDKINKLLNDNASKHLVLDSPGLHFSDQTMINFDENLFNDVAQTFRNANIPFKNKNEKGVGMIGSIMDGFFYDHQDWNIKILQGERDFVMSKVFGLMSEQEYKRIIFSDEGFIKKTKKFGNVKVWTADTQMHTFLIDEIIAKIKNKDGISAKQFILNN